MAAAEIQPAAGRWLFSAPLDLAAFLGSALLSAALLLVGWKAGLLDGDTPDWAWVTGVLLIDVAHVYSTVFRVYFDPEEWRRRAWLYGGVPVACYAVGWALYSESPLWFWRALAYLAVFHFVRQQYGWVALYRAKLHEPGGWQRRLDTVTIYLATLYPLIYWHTHLPRQFHWFRPDDFTALPLAVDYLLAPIFWLSQLAYWLKALWSYRTGRANPGKDLVVATTTACWYVGIVLLNSDYAFTVTNVIIHGIPYMVLVYWHVRQRRQQQGEPVDWLRWACIFLATVWLLAYVEELLWDRNFWHERSWLFGPSFPSGPWQTWLAPLLAVPLLTHYVLDGFIWKRRSNPHFQLIPRESKPLEESIRLEAQSSNAPSSDVPTVRE